MKTQSKAEKSRIYDKNYFELGARSFESSHFNRMLKVYRPLAELLAKFNPSRALDVGCATGSLVKALLERGIDAYGVDVSAYAVNSSPIKDRLKWVDIEEESLPFPDQHFDMVTSLETLEHLNNPERAISEISRVLKSSGFFYMTVPLSSNVKEHVSVLPRSQWLKILQKYGFHPIRLSRLRLLELRLKMMMINWVVHSSIMGPVAKKYGLHKMGFIGKTLKFMYDVLNGLLNVPRPGIAILAVKR